MRLSNSKVNTWRTCPKQYEFKYVHKLERKKKAVQLYRGDWIHQLLMCHYDGESWKKRHAKLTAGFMRLFEEEREELGDLPAECERIFTSYLRHYAEEDKGFRVIDSELDEILGLPSGDEFNFIIDLVLEESDGGIWLMDHKNVKSFMPPDFMVMDSQLPRYFWAAGKLGYKPLRGVIFNELITKPPTVPEFLKSGRLTERKNLVCDVYTYLQAIHDHGLDPADYRATLRRLKSQSDRWFRRTRLPVDRSIERTTMREMMMSVAEMKAAEASGSFPRSTSRDCLWKCDFLAPCMVQYQGGDIREVLRHGYQVKPKNAKEGKR